MGIVRRQSTLNLVWSYVGVLLGYVNKIILYTEILSRAQFGLLELLLTFMTIGTEISLLGTPKMITRFFPIFRGHPTREGGHMFFITMYSLAGFLMLCVALLLAKPLLVEMYQENSPMFAGAFHYILPITLAYTSYRLLSGISGSLFRSVVPNLAFEVVLKILLALLIGVYYAGWISFDMVVLLYVAMHFVPSLIILVDIWSQKLAWKADWSVFRSRMAKIMIQYGIYSSLSDAAAILVQRLDIVLVGYFLGEIEAGTYAIGIYFSSLIAKPNRSMKGILGPLIATKLKERDMKGVERLYQKTALNNMLIAGILWVLMVVNIGPFFHLFPKQAEAYWPAIILGISLLLNTFTGPHRFIVLNSHLFRFDFYANLVMMAAAFLMDWWLIPLYGMNGAAIATLVVTIIYNFGAMMYVRHHLGMFPINRRIALMVPLFAGLCALGLLIPEVIHPIITMALRSTVACGLFALYMFLVKPSDELMELVMMPVKKLKGNRGTGV